MHINLTFWLLQVAEYLLLKFSTLEFRSCGMASHLATSPARTEADTPPRCLTATLERPRVLVSAGGTGGDLSRENTNIVSVPSNCKDASVSASMEKGGTTLGGVTTTENTDPTASGNREGINPTDRDTAARKLLINRGVQTMDSDRINLRQLYKYNSTHTHAMDDKMADSEKKPSETRLKKALRTKRQYSFVKTSNPMDWFRHDSSVTINNPNAPLSSVRSQYPASQTNTMGWYKHEHDPEDAYKVTVKIRGREAARMARKLQSLEKPAWCTHVTVAEAPVEKRMPRVTFPEAEFYMNRNLNGNVWFSHEDVDPLPQPSVRAGSVEGAALVKKSRGLSENWFQYDPVNNPPEPQPTPRTGLHTDIGKLMRDRARGQLASILQEDEEGLLIAPTKPRSKGRSDGEESTLRHRQGNIGLYGISSHTIPPLNKSRLPEEAKENMLKNRGCLATLLGGHRSPPPPKYSTTRRPAPPTSKKPGDSLSLLLGRYGALSPVGVTPTGRRVQPISHRLNSEAIRDVLIQCHV